jgi:hypothetical protein
MPANILSELLGTISNDLNRQVRNCFLILCCHRRENNFSLSQTVLFEAASQKKSRRTSTHLINTGVLGEQPLRAAGATHVRMSRNPSSPQDPVKRSVAFRLLHLLDWKGRGRLTPEKEDLSSPPHNRVSKISSRVVVFQVRSPSHLCYTSSRLV